MNAQPDSPTSVLESANLQVVPFEDKTLYILGTAHVSKASVQEVEELIREIQPDTVCVELCEQRYVALTDENRWKKLDLFKVLREGKGLMLLGNLAVGAYQRRLGQELGVEPGAELLQGTKVAQEVGAEMVLADRDVTTTLKRTWGNVGFWKKMELVSAILASMFEGKKKEEPDIEAMKEPHNLSEMMQEFARALPQVKGPLIDERDLYLISKVREAPGKRIVAVVGAGHVQGMVKHLETPVDRAALETLPKPKIWGQLLQWLLPLVLIGTFVIGLRNTEGQGWLEMLKAWVLPTALFSAIGALVTGGKLLTVLGAALSAPFTTIHPLISVGMVVGPLEAWLRKPTVADCENLHRDTQSMRGFFRNPVTRTLIVTMGSSIGAVIGVWLGLSWVFSVAT